MGKKESRRDYLRLEAFEPGAEEPGFVQISYRRMQTVARRSQGQARECGHIVPAILRHPTAVFEGLRSDEDEDPKGFGWRCYCGVPDQAYHSDGTSRAAYSGQVYLVFVNDEGVAYNWRWERCDPDAPELPEKHEERFKKRLQ